jgi:hypothetical protein
MITKLKRIVLSLAAVVAIGAPALVPASAYAVDLGGVNAVSCGAEGQLGTDSCPPTAQSAGGLNNLIKKIINIFSLIVGVIAVIMIIIGGLKYVTSGGESSNVSGAKNTILYAIVGLIIVALAQFIVRFVLDSASTGLNG